MKASTFYAAANLIQTQGLIKGAFQDSSIGVSGPLCAIAALRVAKGLEPTYFGGGGMDPQTAGVVREAAFLRNNVLPAKHDYRENWSNPILSFNNHPETTKEDVVAALTFAGDIAVASGY